MERYRAYALKLYMQETKRNSWIWKQSLRMKDKDKAMKGIGEGNE